MKQVKRSERKIIEKETSRSYEYNTGSEALNGAPIEIRGAYPPQGFALNTAVTSLIYVMRGDLIVRQKDQPGFLHVASGDQLLIEKGEAYRLDGDADIFYTATPAWTAEQARRVD